jgi:D-arginine dehydrogenase
MSNVYDFVVVGGGIAGVSTASELSKIGSVLLLERESNLAYHTTGRSAAISMESYGNELIRRLTCASRDFFENPPSDITANPLCSQRGALILSDDQNFAKLKLRYEVVKQIVPSIEILDRNQFAEMAPFVSDKWIAGMYEKSAFDLDVHSIHTAFCRNIRKYGGVIKTQAEVIEATRSAASWTLMLTNSERIHAGVIVNAAGAWADVLAQRCHAKPLGIQPLQRTVVVIDPQLNIDHCPYIGTVDEQIFIKPDVGRLMVSPCDETLSEPYDAIPDEMGIAITMDRLETSTFLRPKKIMNRWAGLRVFVPDRSPLLGADPNVEGFIWCAALGGYGIQTAPMVGKLCASYAINASTPIELLGINLADASPARSITGESGRVISVEDLQ